MFDYARKQHDMQMYQWPNSSPAYPHEELHDLPDRLADPEHHDLRRADLTRRASSFQCLLMVDSISLCVGVLCALCSTILSLLFEFVWLLVCVCAIVGWLCPRRRCILLNKQ